MKTKSEAFFFVLAFILVCIISLGRINVNPRAVIWSDAEGYYKYLPGLFIIKDFHKLPAGSIWPSYNDKGEYFNKYSCGVAYFQLPFFIGAHSIGKLKKGISLMISSTIHTPGQ